MLERHVVARAPGELGAEASVHAVFDVRLGGDVADFLFCRLKGLHAWVQFVVLEHGELVDVADVAHGLKLVEVLGVVHEVKHEVVLHRNIECLHLFGLGAGLGDGAFDGVLSLHELVVLGSDVVDHAGGVDVALMAVPVDLFARCTALVLVVVIKETLKLTMGVTSSLSSRSSAQTLQPVARQVLVYESRRGSKLVN